MYLSNRINHGRSIRKTTMNERGGSDYEGLEPLINEESRTSDR